MVNRCPGSGGVDRVRQAGPGLGVVDKCYFPVLWSSSRLVGQNLDVYKRQVPQYANGKYPSSNSSFSSDVSSINTSDPEMKALLRENINMMNILASKELTISWYGKGGMKEKIDK